MLLQPSTGWLELTADGSWQQRCRDYWVELSQCPTASAHRFDAGSHNPPAVRGNTVVHGFVAAASATPAMTTPTPITHRLHPRAWNGRLLRCASVTLVISARPM